MEGEQKVFVHIIKSVLAISISSSHVHEPTVMYSLYLGRAETSIQTPEVVYRDDLSVATGLESAATKTTL